MVIPFTLQGLQVAVIETAVSETGLSVSSHVKQVMNNAFVRHFDNDIDLAGSERLKA